MSTLNELFARNPDELSDADIDEMIAKLRDSRRQFNAGFKNAGSPKLTGKQKQALTLAEKLDLDLDDI